MMRGALFFDTSALGSSVTITAADLKLYGYTDASSTSFNLTLQTGGATYPHDPLVAGDYNKANYSSSGGTFDTTAGFSNSAYNTLSLDATGLTWISKTGTTKFVLRSSRDIAGTAPTGNEYVGYWTYEKGSGYWPQLVVTFTADDPAITAVTASNIAKTTARLNSTITDDGGELAGDTEVRFGYGTTSEAAVDFDDYDTITDWVSGYSEGDNPYVDVASLTHTTTYYFRAQVKNTTSTVTSTNEITFDTLTVPADVSVFNGIPDTDSISLNWVVPSGAGQVIIRFSLTTYPATTADGTLIYTGSSSSYDHESLSSGKTYYYSIWGESGGEYSANAKNLAMTTLGISSTEISGGDTLPTPVLPPSFDQPVDPTALQKFEPFYSLINNFASSWGMPVATMWLIGVFLIIGVLGIAILIETQSMSGTVIAVSVMMMGAAAMQLIPSYFIAIAIAMDLGVWAIERQYG
jgi:hypothetical protein